MLTSDLIILIIILKQKSYKKEAKKSKSKHIETSEQSIKQTPHRYETKFCMKAKRIRANTVCRMLVLRGYLLYLASERSCSCSSDRGRGKCELQKEASHTSRAADARIIYAGD